MSRRVLITGAFRFPEGDAAAFRVQGLARLLTRLGCTVDFAGWESHHNGRTTYSYNGWTCHAMAEFREVRVSPAQRLVGFLIRGHKTLNWLTGQPRYDVVIAYNPPSWFASRLLHRSRVEGFMAVLDATEWYDSAHLPGGRFGLASAENWMRMQIVYPRFERAITISRFLFKHLHASHSVCIPPLLDPARLRQPQREKPPGSIQFLYAGQAGRKDKLGTFIEALPSTSQALGMPVRLTFACMTRDELCSSISPTPAALKLVDAVGRVAPSQVQALYERSHFSVFFREDRRYAWAGFPTKATESWLYGCPIVTNKVGDLGDLIEDGLDGLLVDEDALGTQLPLKLRNMLERTGLSAMQEAARLKAISCFSDDRYLAQIARLIGIQQPLETASS